MSLIQSYKNQSYNLLKQQYLSTGTLFTDLLFPPQNTSIRKLLTDRENIGETSLDDIKWLRPYQIISNPKFIVNGIDPNDLVQGDVGDCWFISAASTLLSIPKLAKFVIPFDQSFDKDYCGLFHFRFWQFGQWVDVVVDDYLPVHRATGKLVFCHNRKDRNEFFGPLLEKAYAKLAGCYDFLDGGDPNNAHVDFTGTICETFDIKKCAELSNESCSDCEEEEDEVIDGESDDNEEDEENEESGYNSTDLESLWIFLMKSFKAKSLMNASFYEEDDNDEEDEDDDEDEYDKEEEEDDDETSEKESETGLWSSHAYSVIQIVDFRLNKKRISLLKLRDPQGELNPYKGEWNINSKKWKNLESSVKKKYNLALNPYGEFYISFEDFTRYFHELNVTHIDLNAFSDTDKDFEELLNNPTQSSWEYIQFFGEWMPQKNSGNTLYWKNRQYLIQILDNTADRKKQKNQEFDKSVLISLMQPYTEKRRFKNKGEYGFEPIQFDIYSVDDDLAEKYKKRGRKFNEEDLEEVDSSGLFYDREVTKRVSLEPGYYVIIPSLDDEAIQCRFLLRFFFNNKYFKFEQELF